MMGRRGNWQAQFDAIAAEVALRRKSLGDAERLIARSFAGVDLTKTHAVRSAKRTKPPTTSTRRPDGEALALAHLQAMKRLDDQIWKLSASTNTALMAARFDFANQDARIAKLKADDAARQVGDGAGRERGSSGSCSGRSGGGGACSCSACSASGCSRAGARGSGCRPATPRSKRRWRPRPNSWRPPATRSARR